MNSQPLERPSRASMERALASITLNLRPVHRLPADGTLILVAFVTNLIFSIVVGCALRLNGFHQLTYLQRCTYYTTVLGSCLILSVGLAPQIVPGARRRLSLRSSLAPPLLGIAICAVLIFPQSDLHRFVEVGIPCLRTGLLCAAASGLLAFLIMRRGFLVTPPQTLLLSGVFAGFTGVAVLALHCPQQNWIHVLVWHLGTPVLAGLGALSGWLVSAKSRDVLIISAR